MGIEPFLLGSSLRMVMSQRLARRICENCKEERQISETIKNNILESIKDIAPEELKKYKIDLSQGVRVFQGKGCDACNGTGLKGRVAIYEVVPINEPMRNIIAEKNGEESLLVQESNKQRIVTMKQDGVLKILKGFTTIEEIERITEGNITLEEENI
jgi:type II secretory ATPase GspE/PulE/Tfp pilus assembly ATPase PilB-like protein